MSYDVSWCPMMSYDVSCCVVMSHGVLWCVFMMSKMSQVVLGCLMVSCGVSHYVL